MAISPSGESCGINSKTLFESLFEIHCAHRLQVEQNPSNSTVGIRITPPKPYPKSNQEQEEEVEAAHVEV